MISFLKRFQSSKSIPIEELTGPDIQITTVSLTDKGLTMLIIDQEFRTNTERFLKLKRRKEEILRNMRDVDYEIDTIVERQRKLKEILDSMSGSQLLSIPGLYEVVSEELNNEIIEAIEKEQ